MLFRYGTDNLFCMSLDLVSHLYLTYVLIKIILDINSFDADAIGLMLDYSIEISEQLLEAFEQGTQVEKSLVILERSNTFTQLPSENCEDEKLKETKYHLSDNSWPAQSKVLFKNFSIKYRKDCDLAFNNINFIGRTGNGKSSQTLRLLRIIEIFEVKLK